jgi:thioredoxin 1
MKTYELTDKNFKDEVLESHKLVLVDFYAEWCGPCKGLAPVIEQIALEYDDEVKVGKIDVDIQPFTTTKYGVRSMPTLLIFKNGSVVDKIVGAVPKSLIEQRLFAHRSGKIHELNF